MQTQGHIQDVAYLKAVFTSQVAGDPSAAVIADCRVNFNLAKVKPLGPDVSLFLGVKRQRDWATFNVAAEGAKPKLVVEITSESTRKNDLGIKVEYYHRAKVPFYLVVDVNRPKGVRHLTLIGHRYTPQGYERIEPDARGRIYLDSVHLYVGVTHDRLAGYDRLACFDPKTGEELGDYTALREAIDKARKETQRAKREAQTATQEGPAQRPRRPNTKPNRRIRRPKPSNDCRPRPRPRPDRSRGADSRAKSRIGAFPPPELMVSNRNETRRSTERGDRSLA